MNLPTVVDVPENQSGIRLGLVTDYVSRSTAEPYAKDSIVDSIKSNLIARVSAGLFISLAGSMLMDKVDPVTTI